LRTPLLSCHVTEATCFIGSNYRLSVAGLACLMVDALPLQAQQWLLHSEAMKVVLKHPADLLGGMRSE
jgi:hypothetical protein